MTRRSALAFPPSTPVAAAPTATAPVTPYRDSRGAMAYLNLHSLDALYWHINHNELPFLRCGGRLRFDTRELDQWLRTSAMRPTE